MHVYKTYINICIYIGCNLLAEEEGDLDGAFARGAVLDRRRLTPYTLNPTPCSIHPTPCPLNPQPYTQPLRIEDSGFLEVHNSYICLYAYITYACYISIYLSICI